MGSIRKGLFSTTLPDREKHNSRLFVDLCENIHIHHREYRTVFSLDEYFEYVSIIQKSTEDVLNYLENNPDYKEGVYPTTLFIAGGKAQQMEFLQNSPHPTKSAYYDDEFAIELQDDFVTDEIHIHYRDFRIAMDRSRFRVIAKGFTEALKELDQFERDETYIRKMHPDRLIDSFQKNRDKPYKTSVMGVKNLEISKVKSKWYKDIIKEWSPDQQYINYLMNKIKEGDDIAPIVLSTEADGSHYIVDGHHRYYACISAKKDNIDAVITGLTFDQTKPLRDAENLLKEFDNQTKHEFGFSSFMKSFISRKLNRYYSNQFRSKITSQKLINRIIRKIKKTFFGKSWEFKNFNESHNDHKD
tara:strand:- start:925 stop:1998 length:1074 start_codon:yes stop_codon:yes gene_type:complete